MRRVRARLEVGRKAMTCYQAEHRYTTGDWRATGPVLPGSHREAGSHSAPQGQYSLRLWSNIPITGTNITQSGIGF